MSYNIIDDNEHQLLFYWTSYQHLALIITPTLNFFSPGSLYFKEFLLLFLLLFFLLSLQTFSLSPLKFFKTIFSSYFKTLLSSQVIFFPIGTLLYSKIQIPLICRWISNMIPKARNPLNFRSVYLQFTSFLFIPKYFIQCLMKSRLIVFYKCSQFLILCFSLSDANIYLAFETNTLGLILDTCFHFSQIFTFNQISSRVIPKISLKIYTSSEETLVNIATQQPHYKFPHPYS